MAVDKKTNAPPASTPTAGNAALAVVATDSEAQLPSANSLGKDALASLEAALSGKGKFEKPEADFWKPGQEGDTLIGAYLGSKKEGRLLQHGFAVKGKDGLRTIRMNGSHVISRVLSECRIGRVARIVFRGQKPTGTDNRKMNVFDIDLMEE